MVVPTPGRLKELLGVLQPPLDKLSPEDNLSKGGCPNVMSLPVICEFADVFTLVDTELGYTDIL